MKNWLYCWQCGHLTPQERLHYELFYRVQEIIQKESDGSIKQKLYAPLISSNAFHKCEKCGAPNFHIQEFWPTEETQEEANKESTDFQESIKKTGTWKKDKLFREYHFPTFQENQIPEWSKNLSGNLMTTIWEIYAAKQHGLYTLCAIGIRTAIDIFAVDKIGDVGGFGKKLDALQEKGHISKSQKDVLSIVIEAGNAAAHRGFSPARDQIEECLKTLDSIFHFEVKNNKMLELKNTTPAKAKLKKPF